MDLPNINLSKYRGQTQELARKILTIRRWSDNASTIIVDLESLTGNLGKYFKIIGFLQATNVNSIRSRSKRILIGKELNLDKSIWIERNLDLLVETISNDFPNYTVTKIFTYSEISRTIKFVIKEGEPLYRDQMESKLIDILETFISNLLEELEQVSYKNLPIMNKTFSIVDEFGVSIFKMGINYFEDFVEKIFIVESGNFNEEAVDELNTKLTDKISSCNIHYEKCKLSNSFDKMSWYDSIASNVTILMDAFLKNELNHPCLNIVDQNATLRVERDFNKFVIGSGDISINRLLSLSKKANEESLGKEFNDFLAELKEIKG